MMSCVYVTLFISILADVGADVEYLAIFGKSSFFRKEL